MKTDPNDPFESFDQLVTQVKPERSLLMSYCAHLPYFETVLLESLQSHGAAEVVVLLDVGEYQGCFSEMTASAGPGVRYGLYPIRLPGQEAAFHPKLFFLWSRDSATLIVASANLTFFGSRTNAEVVDKLTIDSRGKGDITAFRGFLDLLETLPGLNPLMPAKAGAAIKAHADRLRIMITSRTSTDETEPVFLHSGKTRLLDQVASLVPANEVERITAFSPFFDPGALAVRALADQYSSSLLTIVKESDRDGDFNGKALARLSSRLTVKALSSLGKQRRRLHGKLFLFEGKRNAWIVSGSANLTSAAWLKAAKDGGNLEAVVLRRVLRTEVKRLAGVVEAKEIKWAGMTYTDVPRDPDATKSWSLTIMEAEPAADGVELRCDADRWPSGVPVLRVTVEDALSSETVTGKLIKRVDAVAIIRAQFKRVTVDGDNPVLVVLEVHHPNGLQESGRIWLSRPAYLGMSASDRALHRARDSVFYRLQGNSQEWDLVARGFADFFYLLQERWRSSSSELVKASQKTSSSDDSTPITTAELLVDDSLIRVSHAVGRGSSVELFQQLLTSVHGLFREDPPGVASVRSTTSRSHAIRDLDEEELLDEGEASDEDDLLSPRISFETIGSVIASLRDVWAEIVDSEVHVDRIDTVLGMLELTMAGFLVPLYLQAANTQSVGLTPIIEAMRFTWAAAVSLDGLAEGKPRGWLLGAWAQATARESLRIALASPDRVERLTALLAIAKTAVGDTGAQVEWPGLEGAEAGFGLVVGHRFGAPTDEQRAIAKQYLEAIVARAPNQFAQTDLYESLEMKSAAELPIIRAAQIWLKVDRLARADADGSVRADLELAVRSESPEFATAFSAIQGRLRPAVVGLSHSGDTIACKGCNVMLSRQLQDKLRDLSLRAIKCESCGRLLIPFSYSGPVSRVLLEVLDPEFGTDSNG